METIEQHQRYEQARRRVNCIKGFYNHLFAYLFVIPVLAWLNLQTTDFPWVVFPALAWGFGLLLHGMKTFGYHPFLGKHWEERKIRQFMRDEVEQLHKQ